MQLPWKIELVDLSALSNVPFAQRRCAATEAENHTSRSHFTMLAESLKQKTSCSVKGGVEDHRLSSLLGTIQLFKVIENEI